VAAASETEMEFIRKIATVYSGMVQIQSRPGGCRKNRAGKPVFSEEEYTGKYV